MVAAALISVLTGSSGEAGGVIVHVELDRVEHPLPDGVGSWDEVIPSSVTGDRYYWGPTGWVIVERNDGTLIRARNDYGRARYRSRVSIAQSRSGEWFVASVEKLRESEEQYVPSESGPRPPSDIEPMAVSYEETTPVAPGAAVLAPYLQGKNGQNGNGTHMNGTNGSGSDDGPY